MCYQISDCIFFFFLLNFRYSSTSRYSNSSASSYKFSAVREETESDYLYQENRKSSGYSKYANDGGLSNGFGSMSLNGLREPQIDSWDSMGILGLSSKMWKESAKKQENFMSTTSAFAGREENYNSYIMWSKKEESKKFKNQKTKNSPLPTTWLFQDDHQPKLSRKTNKKNIVQTCPNLSKTCPDLSYNSHFFATKYYLKK